MMDANCVTSSLRLLVVNIGGLYIGIVVSSFISSKRLLHRRRCANSSVQSQKIPAHKSVVMVAQGQGKRREGRRVSIKVSVVIRKIHITNM